VRIWRPGCFAFHPGDVLRHRRDPAPRLQRRSPVSGAFSERTGIEPATPSLGSGSEAKQRATGRATPAPLSAITTRHITSCDRVRCPTVDRLAKSLPIGWARSLGTEVRDPWDEIPCAAVAAAACVPVASWGMCPSGAPRKRS
jgi:hypothetical protein